VTRAGVAVTALLGIAAALGTAADVPVPAPARTLGGYHVLAADFHVHSLPSGWATLLPFDTVVEAGRRGLDVIGFTPHNEVWQGKAARWFATRFGGPMVIGGEEITARDYHLIAVGVSDTIPNTLSLADAIREVHRQGGVAIAAHPFPPFSRAYDGEPLSLLDGSEVVRVESLHDDDAQTQLAAFFSRRPMTAIGSSDYHGISAIGYARTYVFARARTEAAVLDALREGRTVVYGRNRVFGEPALIALATEAGGLPAAPPVMPVPGASRVVSRTLTVAALFLLIAGNRMGRTTAAPDASSSSCGSESRRLV
jgi:predicted metal-dependent phosphoesterase TrpH